MKKILSLVLVTVMVMSLSIPVFAEKPAWAGNDKEERVEKELPKGLQDKEVIPYGHRKDQEVTVEDMEALIEKVEDYIDDLDVDSDDDGIEDADEDDELSADIIDLDEAEDIALAKIDGDIVKMSFDDGEYTFEILLEDTLYEVEVDGITKDVDVETEDDEDYDLDEVMSYNQAKAAGLAQVDDDDAVIVEVELDMEVSDDDEDEGEDEEATYTVKVKTATKTYEIEFDAFNGDLLAFDSETNDDDDDDWRRDRDRDRDDDDDDGMVSAIENLIDRIEYELEKDEPKLGRFMFQLEQKFNVLQKNYGEAPEKEDYTKDLEELLASLEDIEDDSVFNDDEQKLIQDLIIEIQKDLDALDDDEFISEDIYEDFEEDADLYLDILVEKVESDDVKDLVMEIRDFIFSSAFGSDIGQYSLEEGMDLLMLVSDYSSISNDALDEYYKDLKLAYKKFKMSKLVDGKYLETLIDYKADLEILEDEDLTDDEINLRDSLIETIEAINDNEKITLATFYDLQEDALTLLEESVEEPVDYEVALDELIEDVEIVIFTSYSDVDQTELMNEKMTLLGHYLQAIEDKEDAETEEAFEKAFNELDEALTAFNDFLEQ